jgi:hypothetical protein
MYSYLIHCIILHIFLHPPCNLPYFCCGFWWNWPIQLDPDELCPKYIGCPCWFEYVEVIALIVIPQYLSKSILVFGPHNEAVLLQEWLYNFFGNPEFCILMLAPILCCLLMIRNVPLVMSSRCFGLSSVSGIIHSVCFTKESGMLIR